MNMNEFIEVFLTHLIRPSPLSSHTPPLFLSHNRYLLFLFNYAPVVLSAASSGLAPSQQQQPWGEHLPIHHAVGAAWSCSGWRALPSIALLVFAVGVSIVGEEFLPIASSGPMFSASIDDDEEGRGLIFEERYKALVGGKAWGTAKNRFAQAQGTTKEVGGGDGSQGKESQGVGGGSPRPKSKSVAQLLGLPRGSFILARSLLPIGFVDVGVAALSILYFLQYDTSRAA